MKISFATAARVWRTSNLQPWRTETFKFSTDPELDAKIRDVVGVASEPAGDRPDIPSRLGGLPGRAGMLDGRVRTGPRCLGR